MRIFKTLLCLLAAVMAFAAGQAVARDLVVNISGTVTYQNPHTATKGTVTTASFNEKHVYALITNAVASASVFSGGAILSTNLPANGYIAYNHAGYDGKVTGTFYVTNKTGFYYPLSGFDANTNYYSYLELDSQVFFASSTNGPGFYAFGFTNFDDPLFFSAASYNIGKNNAGSDASVSKAIFYLHDVPYDYGDAIGGSAGTFYPLDDANENAFEVCGVLKTTLASKNGLVDSGTLSLTGSGNFFISNYEFAGVLVSGHVSFQ